MAVSQLPEIPEYGIWQAMKRRCDSPNVPTYGDYGGRGITVCDRWVNDFWTFLGDMGPRPGPEYTLEREDNDKGYCPENCKWATRTEQARNRRSNTLVNYQGRQVTLAELSELTGIKAGTLSYRKLAGWPDEKLMEPSKTLFDYNGKSFSLKEWSQETGIPYDVLRDRINNENWPIRLALTTPVLKPTEYQHFISKRKRNE